MKTLIKPITIITILLMSYSGFSQIEEPGSRNNTKPKFEHKRNSRHALGLAAGATTGFGLSYLYMPSKLCFQVTFVPYKDQTSALYSAGLTFLYRLREGEKMNFLLYQGNHLISRTETNYTYNPTTYQSVASGKTTNTGFNNGIGIGFEFFLSESVSFNLMGGYAGYNNFERITVTGEGALFYKF
ncbi:MAG: hypothetical protein ACPGVD_05775 [Flavobacteriales bacterium]